MAYISEINQAQTTQAASDKNSPKTKSATLGQQDFLTLLVAQLQNQDPLNPSDPTEFTAQLAQFSELEQLFNLNESMESLANAQNNSERLSALSLIGKEVLVKGSSFTLDQDVEQIGYNVDGTAAGITIQIHDSKGTQVASLKATELGKGNHFINWNGTGKDGKRLPEGKYTISIQAKSSGEGSSVEVTPLVHSLVTGVDLTKTGAKLVTQAGEYSITDIKGVYDKNTPKSSASTTSSTANDNPVAEQLTETAGNLAENMAQDLIEPDTETAQQENN